jgi:hypothetical protein
MAISPEEAKKLLNDHISQQEAANLLQSQSQAAESGNPYSIGARGALAGLLNFGRGIPNTAFRLAQLMGMPQGKYFHPVTEEQIGLNKIISPQERQSLPGILGEFIGGSIPIAPLPMARAPTLLGRLGKSAGLGAALGPVYSPDESLLESAGLGAGIGVGLTGLGSAGKSLFGTMGGIHTPEQVQKIMESEVPGQEVPLAEAIGSPYLKWFQSSVLGKIPFSGMKERYGKLDEANIQRMENVLQDLKKEEVANVPQEIVSSLSEKYQNNQSIKQNLYNDLREKADQYGIKINDNNYVDTIKKSLEPIEKFQKEKPHFKKMSEDTDFIDFLKSESKPRESIDPFTGKITRKEIDYNTAITTDAEINGLIEKAYKQNDRRQVGILKKMQSALREDIDNSVKESKIPELTESWENARNFYKNEIVPLQHKKILPYILGTKKAETIVPTFIKSGKYEQPELANQLLTHLTPEQKENLGGYILSKAGSKEEAKDIASQYGTLGKETKKLLFPEEKRKEIESSTEIAKALGGQKNQMFVPKTGHEVMGGLGVLGLALTAPAILPKIATGGAILGSANLLTKALTNKKSRDLLIKRYLNSLNKNQKQRTDLTKYAYPAVGSLLEGEQ